MIFSKTTLFAVLLMLAHGTASARHSGDEPVFMGFSIGMKAEKILRIAGKKRDALDHVKAHNGLRVISDTLPMTSCKLAMRRSLGFDSTAALTAIGLTYKTTPDHIQAARDCAFEWLTNTYGPPNEEAQPDSVKQEVWQFGETRLTLEAKGYNAQDFFVEIYYYKGSEKAD